MLNPNDDRLNRNSRDRRFLYVRSCFPILVCGYRKTNVKFIVQVLGLLFKKNRGDLMEMCANWQAACLENR